MIIHHEAAWKICEDSLSAMKILIELEHAWQTLGYKTHISKLGGMFILGMEKDIPWGEDEDNG